MSWWFSSKKRTQKLIKTDLHSHLLPGIDDGVADIEESLSVIKAFEEIGFEKLITTPHILNGFYDNTPEIILEKLEEVRSAIKKENINIHIEAAAEYYLDEFFIDQLQNNKPILTFGSNYLLFETGFINKPAQLEEWVFAIQANDYQPIMAHPERYIYLYNDWELVERLYQKGVLFQINYSSLLGYYSKASKKFAEKLIDKKMVHFVGSDCHRLKHVDLLKKVRAKKYYQKLSQLNLLNHHL